MPDVTRSLGGSSGSANRTAAPSVRDPEQSHTATQEPVIRPDVARFLCGGTAGIVSRSCTAPLDRVKVLRQIGAKEIEGQNMLRSLRLMIAEGGVRSLWRGNGVNVLKNCPESAIRFGLYGLLKQLLFPETKGNLQPHQRLLVASLAGATSLTCTYPAEVMKTRMALRKTTDPNSIWHCVQSIYSQGGLFGFYRGYTISMMSYVPYAGMELALYELTKRRYLHYRSRHSSDQSAAMTTHAHVPTPIAIGIILFSSLIPMILIYPANMMRTRFQASAAPRAAPMWKTARTIFANNGFSGLYRGLTASMSKTLPSVCITYLVFEFMSEKLHVPGLGAR